MRCDGGQTVMERRWPRQMKNNLRDASAGSSHFPPPRSKRSIHSPPPPRSPSPTIWTLADWGVNACLHLTHARTLARTHTHGLSLSLSPCNFPSFPPRRSALFSLLSILHFIVWLLLSAQHNWDPFHLLSFTPTLHALNLKTPLGAPPHLPLPPCTVTASKRPCLCSASICRFSFFSSRSRSALKDRKPVMFPKLISDSYYQFSMTVCLGLLKVHSQTDLMME